jgi:hypothetical protein
MVVSLILLDLKTRCDDNGILGNADICRRTVDRLEVIPCIAVDAMYDDHRLGYRGAG